MRGDANRDKVYEFILSYWKEKSYSPTVREICAATGVHSTSSVYNIIHKLISKGLIKAYKQGNIQKYMPTVLSAQAVQYCPFCGNPNCVTVEAKEYRCIKCNTTFIVVAKG